MKIRGNKLKVKQHEHETDFLERVPMLLHHCLRVIILEFHKKVLVAPCFSKSPLQCGLFWCFQKKQNILPAL